MKHYFSRLTLVTMLWTVCGIAISSYFLITNIKPSFKDASKRIAIVGASGQRSVTLLVEHRAKLKYDSIAAAKSDNAPIAGCLEANKLFFHHNPEFLTWLVLICTMLGISFAVMPLLLDRLFKLHSIFQLQGWFYWLTLTLAVLIGAVFTLLLGGNPYLMSYVDWIEKLDILFQSIWILHMVILIPMLSGLIALVGMLVTSKSVSSVNYENEPSGFKDNLVFLNRSLKFFLGVATLLITFAVYTSGALRKAILQEVVVKGVDMVPIEFVYLYGLQFTFVLAVFYFPIYYQFKSKTEGYISYLQSTGKTLADDQKVLLTQESLIDGLKIGISILAPLLSGVLPDLLNL